MAKESELEPAGRRVSGEPPAVVCLDRKNRIISLDPSAEQLFGIRTARVKGRPVDALLAGYGDVAKRGGQRPRTYVLRKQEGRRALPLSVQVRATVLRVRRALVRVLLISPKRTTRALRHCQRLSAIVAHDLRASVGGLLMSMEVLRGLRARQGSGALVDQTIIDAAGALRHMDRLIQDLADAHALNVGAFPIQPERIRPARLLQAALAASRPLVTRNSLDVHCEPNLPDVSADTHRLTQVISNLLGNAAKAAPPNSRIRMSVVRDDGFVTFSVEDRAGGLPSDFAWRLSRPTEQPLSNRGLGLMIAKNIVEAHGGRIWAERRGATGVVSFALPVVRARNLRRR